MKFDRKTIEAKRKKPKDPSESLASTIQFSNHHAPHAPRTPKKGNPRHAWASNRTAGNLRGGGPGAQKHAHTMQAHDLFHTSIRIGT